MLTHVDPSTVHRMLHLGAAIGIIGQDQVTTDIPAHAHLKGQTSCDGRDYDSSIRGLGGNIGNPWTTVGEENITMSGDNSRYPYESILVHEFAHCVMNVGLAKHMQKRIKQAYEAAIENKLYDPTSYIASNEDEYWAEATQAWFNATVRYDATSGLNKRKKVKNRDPLLAEVLAEVWGDGKWRYLHTAPVSEFKKGAPRGGDGVLRRFWKRLRR
jgi:hypothetical protein